MEKTKKGDFSSQQEEKEKMGIEIAPEVMESLNAIAARAGLSPEKLIEGIALGQIAIASDRAQTAIALPQQPQTPIQVESKANRVSAIASVSEGSSKNGLPETETETNAPFGNRSRPIQADLVAKDKHGRIVLLVEYLGGATEAKALKDVKSYLAAANSPIPFAMLVDVNQIQIFKWDGTNLSSAVSRLKSADVLSHYEPEFSNKRIFDPYLIKLVEVWLDDLAFRWKSARPPGAEELAAIGLGELLDDGETEPDAEIKGAAIR